MSFGTGLFQCLIDPMQCVDTWICMPCAASRQQNAVRGHADTLSIPDLVYACCFPACMITYIRHQVVNKYSIEEGVVPTVIQGCCFPGCSLCQTHRELTKRDAWPGGTILHKEPTNYDQLK